MLPILEAVYPIDLSFEVCAGGAQRRILSLRIHALVVFKLFQSRTLCQQILLIPNLLFPLTFAFLELLLVARVSITAHRMSLTFQLFLKGSAHLTVMEEMSPLLPERKDRFLALSIQAHTIGESFLYLLVLSILAHGSVELEHGHFIDSLVIFLEPGANVGGNVSVIFFSREALLLSIKSIVAIFQQMNVVSECARCLIPRYGIVFTENALHRLDWPLLVEHVCWRFFLVYYVSFKES